VNAADTNAATTTMSRTRWWIHLVLIGGYVLIPIALSQQVRTHPVLPGNVVGLLKVSAVEVVLFGAVFGLGWVASRASRDELLLRWRPGWLVLPLGLAYSVAVRLAVGVLAFMTLLFVLITHLATRAEITQFIAQSRPNVEVIVNPSALKHNPAYFWLIVTVVSFVIGGLREELWRAGTLAAMRQLWPRLFGFAKGPYLAITILAVLFAAGHLAMGFMAAVMIFPLGIALGVIMVAHKSIWPAVFAHGFFDATSFALLAFVPEQLLR
jgi:membrane protease YdiL (CAAX protease family)